MTISANTINRGVGSAGFPFDSAALTEAAFVDPVQDTLLALFKAAINDELGDAFRAAASGTSAEGKLPVQDTWPGEINIQLMRQRKAGFPLLAISRTGKATWTERTLDIIQLQQDWEIAYIIGPLGAAEIQRLGNACHRIASLLQLVLWQRGHKAYKSGATQFGDDNSLQCAFIASHSIGQAQFANDEGGALYYGLSATLQTLEYSTDTNPYDTLTGASFDANVGGSDGVLTDLVQAVTEHPPPES